MTYKIIEVHAIYQDNIITEMAVLWESNERGWIRASYCTSKPCAGYNFLVPGDKISPELIQKVAGQGMNLSDEKKDIYFPNKKNWER